MSDETGFDCLEHDAKAIMGYDILKVAQISELLTKAEQRCTASKNPQLQDITDALKKYDNEYLNTICSVLSVSEADCLATVGRTRAEELNAQRKFLCNHLTNAVMSRATQELLNATSFNLAHKLLLMASDIAQNTITFTELLICVYTIMGKILLDSPSDSVPSELAGPIYTMMQQLSKQSDKFSPASLKETDTQLQEAREIWTCIEHTVKIIQNDSVYNTDTLRSFLENELKTEHPVLKADNPESVNRYINTIHWQQAVLDFFRGLLVYCDECITKLSAIQEKNNAVLEFTEKNVFNCRHYTPSDPLIREAAADHLKSNILHKSGDTAMDSFEKLLILDPKKVSKKEAVKVTSICTRHKKGTHDFLGDLGHSISSINQNISNAPEGAVSFFGRLKYLLFSILCTAGLYGVVMIYTEELPETVAYVFLLVLLIGCLWYAISSYGCLIGVVGGLIAVGILANLSPIALAIGIFFFLFKALAPSGKKRRARRKYLDGVKTDIQKPLDHIHLILNKLDQVPAGIDTSIIRAYYQDAAQYLTRWKSYK